MILITGASGFVGKQFLEYNAQKFNICSVSLQNIDFSSLNLSNIDTIVHLAGKAHQMEKIDDQIYFDVNYNHTKNLADAAKKAGVRHFIFISTIKVFDNSNCGILNEKSVCNPLKDPYGQSKLNAERYLQSIEDENFIVSIVRPPLIYGQGVKGNLIKFLKLANKPFPLPFKNIKNRRTMVFLDNLIELINTIIEKRASGVFLASDDVPISTEKLISEIRVNLGKPPNLFKIPSFLLKLLKNIKPELENRLFGSLELNATETNRRLDFKPPFTTEQGIKQMVEWYLKTL